MPNSILFDEGSHRNVLLEDFGHGLAVQANQHVIVHNGEGMILDPGGHKVYSKVLTETTMLLRGSKLKYLFLSHQDPVPWNDKRSVGEHPRERTERRMGYWSPGSLFQYLRSY